jgi:hypothetical protein
MSLENPICETLGTYLFPSVADEQYHMGHMWIYWTDGNDDPPSRGYWPIFTAIPKEFRNAEAARSFLITDKVPGRFEDESVNPELTETMKNQARERKWTINIGQKMWLELRCGIDLGEDGKDEGFYSCDEKREDCDNCCSWSVKVMYDATKNPDFLRCTRPKRLRHVEMAIWGSSIVSL